MKNMVLLVAMGTALSYLLPSANYQHSLVTMCDTADAKILAQAPSKKCPARTDEWSDYGFRKSYKSLTFRGEGPSEECQKQRWQKGPTYTFIYQPFLAYMRDSKTDQKCYPNVYKFLDESDHPVIISFRDNLRQRMKKLKAKDKRLAKKLKYFSFATHMPGKLQDQLIYFPVEGMDPDSIEAVIPELHDPFIRFLPTLREELRKYDTGKNQAGKQMMATQQPVKKIGKKSKKIVNRLVDMGFSKEDAVRACVQTQNQSFDQQLEWQLDHKGDADFKDPLPELEQQNTMAGGVDPNLYFVTRLKQMGFPVNQAKRACVQTQNQSLDQQENWLIEHIKDADFNDPLPEMGVQAEAEKNQVLLDEKNYMRWMKAMEQGHAWQSYEDWQIVHTWD